MAKHYDATTTPYETGIAALQEGVTGEDAVSVALEAQAEQVARLEAELRVAEDTITQLTAEKERLLRVALRVVANPSHCRHNCPLCELAETLRELS